MKDSLFEMLLNLFEMTLTQLKEKHATSAKGDSEDTLVSFPADGLAFVKGAKSDSIRVLTHDEQMKLTKASYQFLMRLVLWGIVGSDAFELIVHQLVQSTSRFVSLEETKWTVRNTLANTLDADQLAFLDLVLYHKEDELTLQ